MENRPILELLKLLQKEFKENKRADGLCFCTIRLSNLRKITWREEGILDSYLIRNAPLKIKKAYKEGVRLGLYWWPQDERAPRLAWLRNRIKHEEKNIS